MNEEMEEEYPVEEAEVIGPEDTALIAMPAESGDERIPAGTRRTIIKEFVENKKKQLEEDLEIWAYRKGLLGGVPNIKRMSRVWDRLRRGLPLLKALQGVMSYTAWRTLAKEYPVLKEMEESCREYRIEKLQEEMRGIADRPERTRMGETARDRLMVEVRQKEMDRLDRLTEARMAQEQTKGPIIPIQINVGYGKEPEITKS